MKYLVILSDATHLPLNAVRSLSVKNGDTVGTVSLPDGIAADLALISIMSADESSATDESVIEEAPVEDTPSEETPSEEIPTEEPSSEDSAAEEEAPEEACPEELPEEENAEEAEKKNPFFDKWELKACYFSDNSTLAEEAEKDGFSAYPMEEGKPLSSYALAAYLSEYDVAFFHLTEEKDIPSLADEIMAIGDQWINTYGDLRILLIAASEVENSGERPFLLTTLTEEANQDDTPSEASSSEAPSSEETPFEEAPVEETPVEEALAEEVPAEENGFFTYENASGSKHLSCGEALFALLLDKPYTQNEESEEVAEPEKKKDNAQAIHAFFEWLELFALSFALVLFIMTFFVRHSPVQGTSMQPTLEQNDVLIISRTEYTPNRGDIVILQVPTDYFGIPYDSAHPLVKRIIAVGGDTIRINFETWEVFVNGEWVKEDYILRLDGVPMNTYSIPYFFNKVDPNRAIYEATVPEGHVFVMGDNRNNSKDSRTLGFIDQRYIVGDVTFRVLPFSSMGSVD